MTKRIGYVLCLVLVAALGNRALAEEFPTHPIRIVVPYPPGGAADVIARILAQHMGSTLGQPMVVENRAGAQGTVGTLVVANANPDGYTLLLFDSGVITVNPVLEADVGYDPVRQFTAVGLAAQSPYAVIVRPSLAAKDLKELAALARAKPNGVTFAAGSGTSRLTGELFQLLAGVKMLYVPYKGASQAVNDLMGGYVDVSVVAAPSAVSMAKAGKVRALVVTGRTRLATLPDVMTSTEAGFPDFEVSGLNGLVAPAGTPPAVIAKLSAALRRALSEPQLIEQFRAAGFQASSNSPAEMNDLIKSELARWAKVITNAGISK
jgi:tripartite-type tricarboxylate transporter receptor subunit TctC